MITIVNDDDSRAPNKAETLRRFIVEALTLYFMPSERSICTWNESVKETAVDQLIVAPPIRIAPIYIMDVNALLELAPLRGLLRKNAQ